jgi:hypothetical protein
LDASLCFLGELPRHVTRLDSLPSSRSAKARGRAVALAILKT